MTTIHYVAAGMVATSGASIVAENDVWRLTAFLALGASIGVLWSCLSKEGKEESRVTKARILAGIVSGICLPRVIEFLSPWKLNLAALDPLLTIAVGFLSAIVGFYVMHSFLRLFETRQNRIGAALMKTVEKSIAAETKDDAIQQSPNPNNRG